jgi:predicted nucleic acid-binding protein
MIVVLDACVLYPMGIRNLLLSLADEDLYLPKWSPKIQDEWVRNLVNNRDDIDTKRIQKTVDAMNKAFPNANVAESESTLQVKLPDVDDNHVLETAIHCKAGIIVTNNLKDFPNDYLAQFDVKAISPDVFILSILATYPETSVEAFTKMIERYKNPPKTIEEVLEGLTNSGLKQSSEKLSELINL